MLWNNKVLPQVKGFNMLRYEQCLEIKGVIIFEKIQLKQLMIF
jgi:hypothetical protein